jgi:metal-responsive CopG/Arc/MetJ family transcriptional regulator
MASKTFSSVKVKVTASLDANLVKAIDGYLKKSKVRSRSQLIEDVIRSWLMEQKKRKLECEIEQYYLSLSDGERNEDQEWTDIAAKSIHNLWEE